jgi:hypothetical protein
MTEITFPYREKYIEIVRTAARGTRLSPAIKRKLTLHAKNAKLAVYGGDSYGGACCPLRAAGVKRTWFGGPWEADGAYDFQIAYDNAMRQLVHMPGPCAISVASRDSQQTEGDPS